MTLRHYAIALAAVVLAIPVFAMLFFLLPVLLPLVLAAPFLIAYWIRAAKRQEADAPVLAAEPAGSIISIGGPIVAPTLYRLPEPQPIERSHAA